MKNNCKCLEKNAKQIGSICPHKLFNMKKISNFWPTVDGRT